VRRFGDGVLHHLRTSQRLKAQDGSRTSVICGLSGPAGIGRFYSNFDVSILGLSKRLWHPQIFESLNGKTIRHPRYVVDCPLESVEPLGQVISLRKMKEKLSH